MHTQKFAIKFNKLFSKYLVNFNKSLLNQKKNWQKLTKTVMGDNDNFTDNAFV